VLSVSILFILGLTAVMGYTGMTPGDLVKVVGLGAGWVQSRINPSPPFHGRREVNILVLGADVSFNGTGAARTDTIKIIHVDLKTPRMSILSIPRDTWVAIPGHGHDRINSAYMLGGKEETDRLALAKTVVSDLISEISGRPFNIHHYVRIQTGGFIHIVDALGGVEIDVEKQMDYEDPSQELYIHLKPGRQRLMGEDAMGYVRFRHDAEGDYGRIRRQDLFIHATVAQMKDPRMRSRLPRLIGPMMKMMVTDIDQQDVWALKRIIEKVGIAGIHTMQLPTVPCYKGRASVVEVQDQQAAAQVIGDLLNGPRPTVLVLNGARRGRLAGQVSELLDPQDYNVLPPANTAEVVQESAIYTKDAYRDAAEELAAQLGVSTIETGLPAPQADLQRSTPPTAAITVVLAPGYEPPAHGEEHAEVIHTIE
jgi:LCP family protein required for cell wall assembly